MRWPFPIPRRLVDLSRALGVAIVCGVGLAVLVGAFNRHYPVGEWLIWRLLPIWGYTLLFNAACVVAGAGVVRQLLGRRRLPALEWLIYSMSVGVVVFVLGMYLAGALCQFSRWTALLLPLLLLAAGHRALPPLLAQVRSFADGAPRLSLLGRGARFLAVAWGVLCLGFMYLGALDVGAINFDATWYHYPTAQDYARIGCIVPFPGEDHRAYPQLTSLIHTWALLVPKLEPLPLHWMLSLHLEFSIVVWRIVGVAAAALWMLEQKRSPALWVVFFLFPSIFVYDQNIGGSADHFLGFFAVPVLLAAARTLRFFQWRWAVLLGIVLGGHVLTKYQAIYLGTAVLALAILRWFYLLWKEFRLRRKRRPASIRRNLGRLLVGPAVAIGVTLAVTAPHFVKNIAFHNNPVYPLGQSVFRSSFPKRPPGYYQEARVRGTFDPKHDGWRRQVWALEHLFEYPFKTANRDFTKHRPYMGALFSFLLPCLLFVRRARRIWFAAAIGVGAFLVWANTAANDRYMLGFLGVFMAVSAALLVRIWELGRLAQLAVVPFVALQLFWAGGAMFYYGTNRARDGLSLIAAGYGGKYDDQRFGDKRQQRQLTAATPPDAVILSRNYKGLLGLDRMVLSDIAGTQDYISYSHVRDVHVLWKLYRSRGVTHLLYPPGKRQPVRWNNTILWNEMFRHTVNVKRFGDLALGQMPTTAPPPSAPYLVLLRKVRGYPDGVYRVEQLDIDGRHPRHFTPAAAPIRPFAKAQASNILSEVNAVVTAGGRLDADANAELQRQFEKVENFGAEELYLRRMPELERSSR